MLFPDTPRIVFKKNTLKEVICQFRFPPILEIASTGPAAFQKLVRKNYPLYEREDTDAIPKDIFPLEITQVFSQFKFMKPPESVVHKFLTEDKNRFISLSSNFLALTDTHYECWEDFSKEMITTKKAFDEIYTPAFYSRLGLRYLDIINPEELGAGGETWKNLVNPALINLLGTKFCDHVKQTQTTTLIEVDEIKNAFITLRHGLISDGKAYQIDADIYIQGKINDENEKLQQFHRVLGNLFRWAASGRLKELLGTLRIIKN